MLLPPLKSLRLGSGRHRFPSSVVTDVDPREAVVRIVKGKLLDHLEHALPYTLNPEIEGWEVGT